MTSNDFNPIKPVEGLPSIARVTATGQRKEKNPQQQKQKNEIADEPDLIDELESPKKQNDENIGLDYCA